MLRARTEPHSNEARTKRERSENNTCAYYNPTRFHDSQGDKNNPPGALTVINYTLLFYKLIMNNLRKSILSFVDERIGRELFLDTLREHIENMVQKGFIPPESGEKVMEQHPTLLKDENVVTLIAQLALDGRGTFAEDELDGIIEDFLADL